MDSLRRDKADYGKVKIDVTHQLYNEPLVSLHRYGVAGEAYYSRPNAATGKPVAGVDKMPYLRKSLAVTLHEINELLQQPSPTSLLGVIAGLFTPL